MVLRCWFCRPKKFWPDLGWPFMLFISAQQHHYIPIEAFVPQRESEHNQKHTALFSQFCIDCLMRLAWTFFVCLPIFYLHFLFIRIGGYIVCMSVNYSLQLLPCICTYLLSFTYFAYIFLTGALFLAEGIRGKAKGCTMLLPW